MMRNVLDEDGWTDFTGFDGVGAARMKGAADGRVDWGGWISAQDDALTLFLAIWIGNGNRAHQGAGVGV